jgi:hypothetical protein
MISWWQESSTETWQAASLDDAKQGRVFKQSGVLHMVPFKQAPRHSEISAACDVDVTLSTVDISKRLNALMVE